MVIQTIRWPAISWPSNCFSITQKKKEIKKNTTHIQSIINNNLIKKTWEHEVDANFKQWPAPGAILQALGAHSVANVANQILHLPL